jgi:DegV family protein with EDD domain
MAAIRVVTDSTADIPPQIASDLGISVIPDEVIFGRQTFRDGVDITLSRFLQLLSADSHFPKTAHPGLGVFLETFRRLGRDGSDLVSIHVGGRLSGMVSSAQVAAKELASEVRVAVIDSQQLSMGQGWQALAAARSARRGASFEEVVALARQLSSLAHVAAVLNSLEHIRRSGRIGRLTALLGSVLQVKPLISVEGGEPVLVGNARTLRRALARLVEFAADKETPLALAVLHAGAPKAAQNLADGLGEFYPRHRILLGQTGAAVATHLGPGAVGLCMVAGSAQGIDSDLFRWDAKDGHL